MWLTQRNKLYTCVQLGESIGYIGQHVNRIMKKIGLCNEQDLRFYAESFGL